MRRFGHKFYGIASPAVCSIDINPFDEGGVQGEDEDGDSWAQGFGAIFDPGGMFITPESGYDAKAEELNQRNMATWGAGVGQHLPTEEEQQLQFGTDVHEYGAGPTIDPAMQQWIWRGNSKWGDQESAFDDVGPSRFDTMGPSAYQDAKSAYGDLGPSAFSKLGPSAYGDLSFDEGRMGEAESYFGDLTNTGKDPIAEADLARKVGEAEQRRKANTDAALAEAETRGMADQGVLAALENAQGSASDQYQAGLDANAMAAGRRDSAAGSLADISERRGRGKLDADAMRAAGMDEREIAAATGLDEWGLERAGGMDKFAGERAGALDEYGIARATGGDKFAGETATGKDKFTGYKTDAQDAWQNNAIDDMYSLQDKNVRAFNDAQSFNVQREQQTGDKNTDLYNDTQYHNKITAPQSAYDDWVTYTSGLTGQLDRQGDNARADAQRQSEQADRKSAERKQTLSNVFSYGASQGGDDSGSSGQNSHSSRPELADPWEDEDDD